MVIAEIKKLLYTITVFNILSIFLQVVSEDIFISMTLFKIIGVFNIGMIFFLLRAWFLYQTIILLYLFLI